MSGADIASEVAAAIRCASAEVGAGVSLTATLVRASGADEDTYPPTPGTLTNYTLDVIKFAYSAMDRNGTDITARDVKLMIAPDAPTVPVNGDAMTIAGVSYAVKNVAPYQPGGVTLYYMVQARAGE